jgi:CheY-like chemotaxis protein/tRNA A-37 threonylcarbamoyl transferase component Bud32
VATLDPRDRLSARVLVVDDDPTIRTALAEAIRELGLAEVSVAASAEDAIGRLESESAPDLVITDLRMRALDGMDLLRLVKSRSPESRVVLMTAYHDVGTAVDAMREGASDFLCKPFDLSTLRDLVSRLLGARREQSLEVGATKFGPAILEAGSSDSPSAQLLADRYELLEEVGRGATATVYRAMDRRHDRSVAVKVMRREVARSIGVDRFLGEITIAASLQHPHVLTLIDSGRRNGVPFYVMPYIPGPSLRRRLDDGRMEIGEAVTMLRDIADALAAAHALDIVHRDVKPENVLLSGRHAWVADFGVARALRGAADSGSTLTGALIGTPLYMAPEQALAAGDVDPRADIYALGVMGWEMLAGKPPFSGPTARAVLTAHMTAAPEPLRELRPEVPGMLDDTVMRCLSKDPEDRWQAAAELSRGFDRCLARMHA